MGNMQAPSPEDVTSAAAYAEQIRRYSTVRVYDKDGRVMFEGTPRDVAVFWRNGGRGRLKDLGSISNDKGETIVRFGPKTDHGFVSREKAELIIGVLNQFIEDDNVSKESAVLSESERAVQLRLCKNVTKEVYFKRRLTLPDDLMLIGKGANPDTLQPLYRVVSGEVGQNFDAHGIEKMYQFEKLLDLLENGISKDKPFSTAPFEVRDEDRAALGPAFGTSGGTCFKGGIAVVTAGYRESLIERGIKHVFVNDLYAGLVGPLQKMFPQYQIHLLSEQKEVLEKEVAENS